MEAKNELPIYAELLRSGRSISVTPKGGSMHPLLDGRSDSVALRPRKPDEVPEKDALVYYRMNRGGEAVHRVWETGADHLVILGDGNLTKEYEVPVTSVYGVVTELCRKGRTFSVSDRSYRNYVKWWRRLYPVRDLLLKLYRFFWVSKPES